MNEPTTMTTDQPGASELRAIAESTVKTFELLPPSDPMACGYLALARAYLAEHASPQPPQDAGEIRVEGRVCRFVDSLDRPGECYIRAAGEPLLLSKTGAWCSPSYSERYEHYWPTRAAAESFSRSVAARSVASPAAGTEEG